MAINPHPETTTSTFSRTPIPNQRHQDWASGHAIGRSRGIREGIEASEGMLKIAQKLFADTFALLEAAKKGE